jgi:hypothetical protein
MKRIKEPKMLIGWREWVALPDLGIPGIKVKVDTGAKTSTLHAFDIIPFTQDGCSYVSFKVHPLQQKKRPTITCTAPLVGKRKITNSDGQSQMRYVVTTKVQIAEKSWDIELTLNNRDGMKFRMLLGRDALKGRLIVDSQLSLQAGAKSINKLYSNDQLKESHS